MPWEVKQNNGKYCVFKKGRSTPIKGGCHDSQVDARRHQKALYASEGMKMGELMAYVKPMRFAEFKDDLLWLEALPAREYHTTQYGEVVVTNEKLQNFVDNFKNGVRGQDIATDYEHGLDVAKGNKASGWIKEVDIKNNSLWLGVKPTPVAKQEIENDEWRYFSLDWEDLWPDNDGKIHQDVIVGGAFTNRPIAKNIMPINFSEIYVEREGGTLDTEVKDEHAAEEHMEPGETEPDPNTNPDDATPDRHVTVPGDSEKVDEEGRPQTNTKENEVGDEKQKDLDAKLRETLGLAEDADIIMSVADLKEEVGPLHEVARQFAEKKKFSELFPREAAELEEARKERLETKAIKFSETVGEMKFGPEGKHQFSQLVLDKIANMHKQFSEGVGKPEDLEELFKAIGDEKALVEIGERGSGNGNEIKFTENDNPRTAFSEAVKIVMQEDDLPYEAALKVAAEKHPELAEAYQRQTVRA